MASSPISQGTSRAASRPDSRPDAAACPALPNGCSPGLGTTRTIGAQRGTMPDIRKLPFGIANRRRDADEWDKTIVAFQSPYQLKDLCLDQSQVQAEDTTRVSRQEFKVRIATTEDRRKSASLLIEKMYSWRGYEADSLH